LAAFAPSQRSASQEPTGCAAALVALARRCGSPGRALRAGGWQDHIVVTSDSGRIVVLSYNKEHNRFDKARALSAQLPCA
jgi:hypothetical protein